MEKVKIMGFFDSESNTTTDLQQEDRKQLAEGDARNVNTGTRSESAVATDNGRALFQEGSGNYAIFEDLNADLAEYSIGTVSDALKSNFENALSFTEDGYTGALDFVKETIGTLTADNRATQSQAFDALDDVKDFAAFAVENATETADDRLKDFSTLAFIGLAALAGLLVWRGV